MKNKFTWAHGPINIEITLLNNTNQDEFSYSLNLSNTSTGYSRTVDSAGLSQIDCLDDCFAILNSRDFKQYGCLIDPFATPNKNNIHIIKSFRNTYRTIVTTDEERLGTHYIDLIRHDCNFKHSEFENENTETIYSIAFGFIDSNFPSLSESFEIGDLSFNQVSDFVQSISKFANN